MLTNDQREIRLRKIFACFVLLGWIHLAFALYPIPSQMNAEIAIQAEQAVAAQRSLIAKGVSIEGVTDGTKEEWVKGLTRDYWTSWVTNLMFLVAGIAGAIMAFQGRKRWAVVVGLSSALFFAVQCYPLLNISMGERSLRWIRVALEVLFRDGVHLDIILRAYFLFGQPIYHLGIIVLTVLLWRKTNQGD